MKMRTTLYKILVGCTTAILMLASCIKDTYTPGRTGGDGDSIILDIASETLPLTRSKASGAEIAVDHLDVLIFEENGAYGWHERIASLNGSREGTVTLSAKREDFTANAGYWVYLVANSSHPAEDFNDIDLNGLRSMVEETRNIHLTGWEGSGAETAPENFLMDGIAYPGANTANTAEPANPGTVVLNDGVVSNDTKLKVTLRRAAAKIVVKIARGKDVTFTDSPEAGFYLSNMPWTSSVVSGVDAPAELRTPDLFRSRVKPFYDWTADGITVTTYAYAHEWADASALENELRLVVNIPLKYNPETSADDESAGVYEDSYYQIPVSRDKVLERNTCYEVRVTVNTPGATNPSKPVTLDEIEYEVVGWTEKTIDVGGETEGAAYLSLNRYELELHNIENDSTSLVFASSSPVSVRVDRVWYIDKFGQEQEYSNQQISRLVSAGADAGLNGNLTIHSDLPTNNTIRYIELTVSNVDNIDRTVLIRQYPLEYITNVQGWYSYRDDFGEIRNGQPTITDYNHINGYEVNESLRYGESLGTIHYGATSYNGTWSFSKTPSNSSFFGAKVANKRSDGTSTISYYYWEESYDWWRKSYYYEFHEFHNNTINGLNNARMYHIQITSTSDDYTLGRPRITDGKTDPNIDNAEVVSPSFMIASQLGAVQAASSVEMAASHCEQYVEVDENGNVYDNWRLPTKAEVEIIYKFQYPDGDADAAAMDEVMSGDRYWSASGLVNNPHFSNHTDQAIRCVRDVYGDGTSGTQN